MLLPPYELHERIRLIRFFSGLNQAEMAGRLGMTQSWLSKLEAGNGELNAEHLRRLRQHFHISADSILDGNVPYGEIARRLGVTPKLPKKYALAPNCRVRMLYGFVALFEQKLGKEGVLNFLKNIGLPVEILADPNFRISLSLILDFISFGSEQKLLTNQDDWRSVGHGNLTPLALGNAHASLAGTRSPKETFEKFCEIGRHYTTDFSYRIGQATPSSIEIQADHAAAMKRVRSAELPLLGAMSSYHQAILEALGKIRSEHAIAVEAVSTDALTYRATWRA